MKIAIRLRLLASFAAIATLAACGGGATTVANSGVGGSPGGGSSGATPGTLALSAANYAFTQTNGTATLVVSRTGGTSGAVTAQYATSNGTAIAGTHYTASSGMLNWADGDAASKSITVPLASVAFAGSRTFNVTISAPTGSAALGTPATAVVTVTGSTAAAAGALALNAASLSVTQASGTATLNVTRTGGAAGAVTVQYATANGTAVAGTNYTAATGTLSWADGDAAVKPINLTLGSTAFSGTLTFSLAISAPTGGATLASPAAATVSVVGSAASGSLAIHVSGNHFVDATGATVQLRGVNVSGLEFVAMGGWSASNPWGGQTGTATPNWNTIKTWAANAVRIPLNEASWLGLSCLDIGGYQGAAARGTMVLADPGANYQATVIKSVADATAAGLYVILDLHWAAPNQNGVPVCPTTQNAMADADHSITFWTSLANTFKANPAVVFELFNEPFVGQSPRSDTNPAGADILNGTAIETQLQSAGSTWTNSNISWQTAGMQAMLDAVRAAGSTNVVLVGGDSWSQVISNWLTYKATDPAHQLGAAWHPYPIYTNGIPQVRCPNQPSCSAGEMTAAQNILAAGYPVVATEYGDNLTTTASASSPWSQILLPFLDSKGISYLGWTWDTWGGTQYVLIKDAAGMPSFGYGTYVKQHYLCVAAGTANCP